MTDPSYAEYPQHVPLEYDWVEICSDFTRWGWKDYKVDVMCDLPNGYVGKLRSGQIKRASALYANRIYNLWVDETISAGATLSTTT